jgi:hypothetical protein
VNDLVQRADLRVEERREQRMLFAVLVGFGKSLLDFAERAGLDVVGPDLVNHDGSLDSKYV